MKRTSQILLLGFMLAGCAAHGPTASVPPPPPSHSNGDLHKQTKIAGLVYQVSPEELVIRSEHAALRVQLPPNADQLISQGKHLNQLHKGDMVSVNLKYLEKGIALESFELLPDPHGMPGHSNIGGYQGPLPSPTPNLDHLSQKGDKHS